MHRKTQTFGDFWDEVAKKQTPESEIWLDAWREKTGLRKHDIWLAYKQLALDGQLVCNFTQDILCLFQSQLGILSTNENYRAFLDSILTAGLKFGIDVSPVIKTLTTLIELQPLLTLH